MVIVRVIAIVIGLFIISATLLPASKSEKWWVRVFDFPRAQIVAIGVVSIVLWLLAWINDWAYLGLLVILLASIVYQLFMIFPYTPFAKKQVLTCTDTGNKPVFSLMVMNVYMHNNNVEKAIEIILKERPDILIAVETNHSWNNKLGVLKKDYPFYVLVPLENTYGMALYSKLRLINPEVRYINSDDVPSIFTEVQMPDKNKFRLYAVHPKPPVPGHSNSSSQRDVELISIGKETRKHEGPIVVAGDLNDVAWSVTTRLFQRFSELLDPRIGRGMFNTFNAQYKLLRWPLDHIFHSDHFQLAGLKTLPYFGSDHFPICAKLCYVPSAKSKQVKPMAKGDDLERAQEKLDGADKI
jgi:endonuclease/exonuclease/phosphatase (EEP) superfamily protein YafD